MRAGEALAAAATLAVLVMLGCSQKKQQGTEVGSSASTAQTTCPVMGGAINRSLYADHDGRRVYFCCAACVDTFKADPEKYIKKLEDQGVVLEKVPAADVWTCPMHPDVRQDTPGKCPTCRMDLVPAEKAGGAGAGQHEEGMHHGE